MSFFPILLPPVVFMPSLGRNVHSFWTSVPYHC